MENSTTFCCNFQENSTLFNNSCFNFNSDWWRNDVIVSSCLAAASVYLFIALVSYYNKAVEKPSSIEEVFLPPSERKYRLLSIYICIVVGFVSMVRHVYSIGLLTLSGLVVFHNLSLPENTTMCDVLPRFDVIAYIFGISLVMLFLWFRQKTFYVHSHIKMKCFKCWKVFSYFSMLLVIFSSISSITIFVIKIQYRYCNGNCLPDIDFDKDTYLTYSYVLVLALQMFLVMLFNRPIQVLRAQRSRGVQPDNRDDRLYRKVHKAIVLASLCYGADSCVMGYFILFYRQNLMFGFFPFSINLFINHLATIACFDCWKVMLWPWSIKSRRNGFVDTQLYPITVFPSDTLWTITDPGAHTSIREIRSSI